MKSFALARSASSEAAGWSSRVRICAVRQVASRVLGVLAVNDLSRATRSPGLMRLPDVWRTASGVTAGSDRGQGG
jgi:hypothetical protein